LTESWTKTEIGNNQQAKPKLLFS